MIISEVKKSFIVVLLNYSIVLIKELDYV